MQAYLQKQIYKDNIRSLISNSKSMELHSQELNSQPTLQDIHTKVIFKLTGK